MNTPPAPTTPTTPTALPPLFPFTAIAGQPALTEALLLAAADPALGGVLVEGPRGTAKSTAARALAELLDGAPFVTLPLGASLEQLVGTLDIGAALEGRRLDFAPGLLARAHGGVLYVDEVNLLPDALVDVLLDAAASGVNRVERDGISQAHAARFVLVGTMNREEGELRPQLLDRFGLSLRLENITEPAQRQAVVRARLAFDGDPETFRSRHAGAQADLQARLASARATLAGPSALELGDAVHARVGQLCIEAQVDGLRADLVMLRAARALAALEGAGAVLPGHVDRVAELVLAHRRGPEAPAPGAAAPAPSASPPRDPPSGAAPAQRPPAPPGPDTPAPPAADPPDPTASERPASDIDHDVWGAMPPSAVGIERIEPSRALLGAYAAKKA